MTVKPNSVKNFFGTIPPRKVYIKGMKFIIYVLSVFALLSSFVACSNGSGTSTGPDPFAEGDDPSSSASKGDSSVVKRDTTFAPEEVLYYSSAVVFCWNDGCEAEFAPTSSDGKSSSSNGGSTAKSSSSKAKSSSSAVKPVVDENAMTMTDKRTGKVYKLKNIDGILWTTTNLIYGTTSGNGVYCANNKDGKNACEVYGTFYDYETAQNACPSGWRLPTKAEAEAALKVETSDDWKWVLTGRFVTEDGKVEYSKEGSEGRLWVADDDSYNTLQLGSGYTGWLNATYRGQNVRCVTEATQTSQSSSSAKSSASQSSSSEIAPTVDDKEETLTDNRTGISYKLRRVDGGPNTPKILWMTTNLVTETTDNKSNGIYCTDPSNGENVCEVHGTFYSYEAAQKACPSGWRLPTESEAQTASQKLKNDDKNKVWTLDGRFKLSGATATEFGQAGEYSYIWIQFSESGNNTLMVKNNGTVFDIFDQSDRAYNVRCVKASSKK